MSEVNAPLTWHLRIVEAVAAKAGCTASVRRRPRVIGGRVTSKADRIVVLSGEHAQGAAARIEHLIGDLNARSEAYARSLPEGLTPTQRKLARRTWLEKAATKMTGDI